MQCSHVDADYSLRVICFVAMHVQIVSVPVHARSCTVLVRFVPIGVRGARLDVSKFRGHSEILRRRGKEHDWKHDFREFEANLKMQKW